MKPHQKYIYVIISVIDGGYVIKDTIQEARAIMEMNNDSYNEREDIVIRYVIDKVQPRGLYPRRKKGVSNA